MMNESLPLCKTTPKGSKRNVKYMKSSLLAVPLNVDEVSSALLNVETRTRTSYFPWRGQFSPQFAEVILERYGIPGTSVLDPFCGVGTVLMEACRLGLTGKGIELNPAAYILARVYTLIALRPLERERLLNSVENHDLKQLSQELNSFVSFDKKGGRPQEIHEDQKNIKKIIEKSSTKKRIILEAFVILLDLFKTINTGRIIKVWVRLKRIIMSLPYSGNKIDVVHGDGRYPSGRFDLVFTSPPYINVYNYHEQYRLSAEVLGWDILRVAASEIGSNRKYRGNRFLMVIEYCLDMVMMLASLWNCTSEDARLVFVMGRESKVRGLAFFNACILADLAHTVGYGLILRQERMYGNRFRQKIYENILHFNKKDKNPHNLACLQNKARRVAAAHLLDNLDNVKSKEVSMDLMKALERIDEIKPSPPYGHLNGDVSNRP